MAYIFNEISFIETFNAKSPEEKPKDSFRLTHNNDKRFKLFPYNVSSKSPVVYDLRDVVSGFFRIALKKNVEAIEFESLCTDLLEEMDIEDEDIETFKELVRSMFFEDNSFVAKNLGLYPYQTTINNRSANSLAQFLFTVFEINDSDCKYIQTAKDNCKFTVLEELLIKTIENKKTSEADPKEPYYAIKNSIQDSFKNDFKYMLDAGMTSLEDFANLFSVYYFFYVSQTCLTLDRFCGGDRAEMIPMYFALDWEKVSKNRQCCNYGWNKLQASISRMFSHAITLEIINQTDAPCSFDYISLGEMAAHDANIDSEIAHEITVAENTYTSYVGDYPYFNQIEYREFKTKTETAIRHLYKCVERQFLDTDRNRASQGYRDKFSEYCKKRWIKNRKKSGLVLNLSENDIIFLTKIALKNNERMRLNDLYKEFQFRGIYLDNTSKEHLQEYFTRLNLIDKKSDSGDAQYVKRIL